MQPEKTIGILSLPQKQINRQFYEMLVKAEAGDATAIKVLQDAIGDATTANTILYRLKQIEDTIGSETTDGTILYRIKQLEEKGVLPSDDQS